MNRQDHIKEFEKLGAKISSLIKNHYEAPDELSEFKKMMISAFSANSWFTEANILASLSAWAGALQEEKLERWMRAYAGSDGHGRKIIGVINAGNIPFVGMHDLLAVLITGNKYLGKNAGDDPVLLPFIAGLLTEANESYREKIEFVSRLHGMDAVVATGSNNSSRYFDYYFGKYPNIIRRNRNAVAVLTGHETAEELSDLGRDIFTYFGLGCRNVSKLHVPSGYDFSAFFEAMYKYNDVLNHNKYINNFDYNNSVLLLKQVPFLQNGFLIIMQDTRIASPISIVHYEKYESLSLLEEQLAADENQLQCIVSKPDLFTNELLSGMHAGFGMTQQPELWNYADRADTVAWLLSL